MTAQARRAYIATRSALLLIMSMDTAHAHTVPGRGLCKICGRLTVCHWVHKEKWQVKSVKVLLNDIEDIEGGGPCQYCGRLTECVPCIRNAEEKYPMWANLTPVEKRKVLITMMEIREAAVRRKRRANADDESEGEGETSLGAIADTCMGPVSVDDFSEMMLKRRRLRQRSSASSSSDQGRDPLYKNGQRRPYAVGEGTAYRATDDLFADPDEEETPDTDTLRQANIAELAEVHGGEGQ